jgi:uncharacterized protein (DUF2236 family)
MANTPRDCSHRSSAHDPTPLDQTADAGKLTVMTKLLEKAFAEAVKLPKKEQDKLAKWLLAELESEQRWDEAFARSGDRLGQLADLALKEHRKGRTKPLDPEQL